MVNTSREQKLVELINEILLDAEDTSYLKNKLERVKEEINWIISTTNDELTLSRCRSILKIIEE